MMTHYIVVSSNEIVKAEMERPSFSAWLIINPCVNKDRLIKPFQEHCLSLPRIPIKGKHNWEVWQEVVEGKDFEFMVKGYSMGNEMLVPLDFAQGYIQDVEDGNILDSVSAKVLRKHLPDRIVAIPIQPTPEGEKVRCEYELAVIEYFGLPEDVSFNKRPNVIFADLVDLLAFFDQKNKPKGDVSHLLTPLEELKLDSNTIRLIERLKELQPYHINPYNLGDEGEVSAIIDKLANLLTNDNTQTK